MGLMKLESIFRKAFLISDLIYSTPFKNGKKEFFGGMDHKDNLYFALMFEKEEFNHRARQVELYLQFCTDNITVSTIFYLLKIQNLTPGIILL